MYLSKLLVWTSLNMPFVSAYMSTSQGQRDITELLPIFRPCSINVVKFKLNKHHLPISASHKEKDDVLRSSSSICQVVECPPLPLVVFCNATWLRLCLWNEHRWPDYQVFRTSFEFSSRTRSAASSRAHFLKAYAEWGSLPFSHDWAYNSNEGTAHSSWSERLILAFLMVMINVQI